MIRLLQPEDDSKLRDLRLLSLKTDPQAFLSTFDFEQRYPLRDFTNRIYTRTTGAVFGYWGYFEDNELIGYVLLSHDFLPKTEHVVRIYELYVRPEFRGKGIAKQLLHFLIDKLKKNHRFELIILDTVSNNVHAITFYLAFGFSQVATIPRVIKENNELYLDQIVFSFDLMNDKISV